MFNINRHIQHLTTERISYGAWFRAGANPRSDASLNISPLPNQYLNSLRNKKKAEAFILGSLHPRTDRFQLVDTLCWDMVPSMWISHLSAWVWDTDGLFKGLWVHQCVCVRFSLCYFPSCHLWQTDMSPPFLLFSVSLCLSLSTLSCSLFLSFPLLKRPLSWIKSRSFSESDGRTKRLPEGSVSPCVS